MDVVVMVTLLLLDDLAHNWGLPLWVSGIFILAFAILFVRYWFLAVRDYQRAKSVRAITHLKVGDGKTRWENLPKCGASTRRGAGFVECTFPRDHPPGSHSWTVDV